MLKTSWGFCFDVVRDSHAIPLYSVRTTFAPFSPLLLYSVLTTSSVLRSHPILYTPCSCYHLIAHSLQISSNLILHSYSVFRYNADAAVPRAGGLGLLYSPHHWYSIRSPARCSVLPQPPFLFIFQSSAPCYPVSFVLDSPVLTLASIPGTCNSVLRFHFLLYFVITYLGTLFSLHAWSDLTDLILRSHLLGASFTSRVPRVHPA